MPRVGFEPKISAFERAKTFHALDHAATVISPVVYMVGLLLIVNQNKCER
jgi:hypothetical protein